MEDIKSSKAFMLESQIMHQIRKLQKKLDALDGLMARTDRKGNPDPEYTVEQYWIKFYSYNACIMQLMIVLTCHDNPLSNYSSQEQLAIFES